MQYKLNQCIINTLIIKTTIRDYYQLDWGCLVNLLYFTGWKIAGIALDWSNNFTSYKYHRLVSPRNLKFLQSIFSSILSWRAYDFRYYFWICINIKSKIFLLRATQIVLMGLSILLFSSLLFITKKLIILYTCASQHLFLSVIFIK